VPAAAPLELVDDALLDPLDDPVDERVESLGLRALVEFGEGGLRCFRRLWNVVASSPADDPWRGALLW
jgi:hypothetical protein